MAGRKRAKVYTFANTKLLCLLFMGKRQEELVKWAKETKEFYLNVIDKIGDDKALSFYNQSKLTESLSCELMVIGFNPGEGCIFSEWNNKSFSYSQDFLLEGNPCFWNKDDATILEEYRDHWDIWRKIHKMLTYGSRGDVLEDLSRFVFTNMIFFGSNKETELGPLRQFSVECSRRTLELIPVLRPSVVLLNGCGQMFEKVADVKLQSLFPFNAMSFVVCNGTLFLSIKHTAYRYTDEEMVLIGKTLGYALDYPTDFCPERVSVMFEAEKQAYITRVHQQKESSRQNKADRHKQAEDILTAVRNKFLCAELPKGMGHNKSYHGLSLSDGKIEVYTTDTKAELIQIFWDSGIDERIAIILEDKLKGYMFTCKSSERKAYIRDIKPEIFIENVLPSLLELLN